MEEDLGTFLIGLGEEHLVAVVVLSSFGLLLGAVVFTSVTLRRPGVPRDIALPDPDADAPRDLDTLESGVKDATGMRFKDVDDVVETLARVSLAPATAWREGETLIVELPVTGSSRDRAGGRREAHVCRWETGFLAEGLRRFASGRIEVRETACRAAGAPACRFLVRGPLPLAKTPPA